MEALLYKYASSIIFFLILILALFIMIQLGYGKYVDSLLLYFVNRAETEFGSGTGAIKKAAVITWIYEKLPVLARIIFTKNQLSDLVELAVKEMKAVLETKAAKDAEAEANKSGITTQANT